MQRLQDRDGVAGICEDQRATGVSGEQEVKERSEARTQGSW